MTGHNGIVETARNVVVSKEIIVVGVGIVIVTEIWVKNRYVGTQPMHPLLCCSCCNFQLDTFNLASPNHGSFKVLLQIYIWKNVVLQLLTICIKIK